MYQNAAAGKYTIGADPEAFLQKADSLVAVQPYVTGTKDKPQPLPLGGNAQRDNVAIEFGILPAETEDQFVQYIGDTMSDLLDLLPDDVNLNITPSANFPESELTHPECKEFGCDPDFNAWTMEENKPPEDAAEGTFRSCGGHIHIGYVVGSGNEFLKDIDGKAMTIRMMDCLAGLVATVLDNNEAAIARRKLYGKAGCCRWTEYGVEYRTLSNFWITSPKLVRLMYHLTGDALNVMRVNAHMDILQELGSVNVQRVITEGDADVALDMIAGFMTTYMSDDSVDLFWECFAEMETETSFKEEWKGYL